ncbi:site-specific integrase [Denitromonas sp.]|uniref:tyrosine-type recombinase/integrase n=1 Tax=Denitromonas sp. TaxID=2734609 RepID=UPI002AFE21C2|nr:site-specific integrase [Denitromonas sp.]
MAKPYKEGTGWAYRLRVAGQDIYRSGFKSEAQARAHMQKTRVELTEGPAQARLGPNRTSLGVAFSDYARERLPYLKGAEQDARRINRYLRALRLPVIALAPVELTKEGKRIYWTVSFVEEAQRAILNCLAGHRARQDASSAESDRVRKRLATMMMADVTTHHIQGLINALVSEGKKSATVHLERAELRRLFKHASAVWRWRWVGGNPAGDMLDMPAVDPGRDRVITNEEWQRLAAELVNYGNPHVAPLACLMLETAMRSCEPLVHLRWRHIDWTQRILELPDAKCGSRKVPLTPGALQVLSQLKAHASTPPAPDDKVFPTSYQAAKKAWAVARERAGVEDVGLHDLRHTAATRFALEFKGNVPVLMVITGHKTVQMVMRYVNVKATEVATMLHGEELDALHTAAGYQMSTTAAVEAAEAAKAQASGDTAAKAGRRGLNAVLTAQDEPAGRAAKDEHLDTQERRVASATGGGAGGSNIVVVDFGRRAA